MRNWTILGVAAVVVCAGGYAGAQEVAERYRLDRTDNGYVRMDTQSGRMSLCREQGEQLVCRMASDDIDAYDRDIEALHGRVEALEERIAALEGKAQGADLPDEAEFEQTLGYMERFFRRFMGIVKELESEAGSTAPDKGEVPSEPGRT